jgi:hypothetical protein
LYPGINNFTNIIRVKQVSLLESCPLHKMSPGYKTMSEKAGKKPSETQLSPDLFRRLALALPEAVESSHMGAPDFRIHNSIFATLAYGSSKGLGTLKLTPEQQADFLADAPNLFTPAPGGWGRMGMTLVRLDAPEDVLAGALSTAFHNTLAKQTAKKRTASTGRSRARRLQ